LNTRNGKGRKTPKKVYQKSHSSTPTPPFSKAQTTDETEERTLLKTQFTKLQLAVLARALKPITLDFDLRSTDSIITFSERIATLALKKEITERLLVALNGVIGNMIRLYAPPTIQQNVAVTNVFDEKAIRELAQKLEKKPEKGREAIIDAIANIARTETSRSSS